MKIININEVNFEFAICDDCIFIHHLWIDHKFRKQHRLRNAIDDLMKIYNKSIVLESFETLIQMYEHIGFYQTGEYDDQGYVVMRKDFLL
jgi:predicted GNAT family N-acyltransferase